MRYLGQSNFIEKENRMVGEVGNGGLLNGSKVCFIDKKIPEDGW